LDILSDARYTSNVADANSASFAASRHVVGFIAQPLKRTHRIRVFKQHRRQIQLQVHRRRSRTRFAAQTLAGVRPAELLITCRDSVRSHHGISSRIIRNSNSCIRTKLRCGARIPRVQVVASLNYSSQRKAATGCCSPCVDWCRAFAIASQIRPKTPQTTQRKCLAMSSLISCLSCLQPWFPRDLNVMDGLLPTVATDTPGSIRCECSFHAKFAAGGCEDAASTALCCRCTARTAGKSHSLLVASLALAAFNAQQVQSASTTWGDCSLPIRIRIRVCLDSVLVRGTAWRCRALPPEDGHLSFWSSQLTIRRLRVSPARPHTQRHCGCSALSSHVCVQPGVFGASGVRALIAIDYSFRTSSKCSFDNTCDVCKSNARQSTHPQPWLAKRIIPVHG